MKHTNNWLKWEKVHIPTNVRAAKERKRIYYKESSSPLNKYVKLIRDKQEIELQNSSLHYQVSYNSQLSLKTFAKLI